ncbi:hypothetical protein STRCI_005491 [Streptomyces cinnabarinus]|uniref:Uncharacterized protein n=1 Tax=Streptomyces cinnabarinus TaxID=67287 RepID=A0ABY7KK84_9ACTN|nr:hypothetical protein [Streptomyces cinnabarinus]WAZ24100.1 hypothetical protein STRCI_005491 [Streptomyces cinnabarinus]
MKSEDTPFEGGPMDGRVLPVLLGITGHPPKTYRIPVPDPDGGPPAVLVYSRVPRVEGRQVGLSRRWKYLYDPEGRHTHKLKWPWAKPDATPGGKPDDADG